MINRTFNITERIGILSVCLYILWGPLIVWYIYIDSAGRIPFLIMSLASIICFPQIRRTALKKPLTFYVFIAIYMIVNGLLKGSQETYPKDGVWIVITGLITPILSMLILTVCAKKNFDLTLKWISNCLLLYSVLSIINSNMGDTGRLNSEINANEIALNAVIGYGLLILRYLRSNSLYLICLAIIPAILVVMTGSRMGLVMMLIMTCSIFLIKVNFKKPQNIIKTIFVASCLALSIFYIMNNTVVGERLKTTTSQTEEEEELHTGTILDIYGDRGFQYYTSWPIFLQHPITGIGFHRWKEYSLTGHVCHSEYMVQYVEGGIVSFIPFLAFFIMMISRLKHKKKYSTGLTKDTCYYLLGMLITIIFSNSVLWSYNMICVFAVYALVFSYSTFSYEKE